MLKICPNCSTSLSKTKRNTKYCNNRCQMEYQYKVFIEAWLTGRVSGVKAGVLVSRHVRRYIKETRVKHVNCVDGQA